MEAVDGGDVGEDPCNDVVGDSSLCELSAKYLRREKKTHMYTKTHVSVCKVPKICLLFTEQVCKHRQGNFHVVVYPHKHSFSPDLAS